MPDKNNQPLYNILFHYCALAEFSDSSAIESFTTGFLRKPVISIMRNLSSTLFSVDLLIT